jgi:hypothetical protein
VREQRALLEDHADPALLGLHPAAGRGHHPPGDAHAARVRAVEPGDDAQERRLPGAARADQRDQTPPLHLERRPVERGQGSERLPQPLDVDDRFAHNWFRPPVAVKRRPSGDE